MRGFTGCLDDLRMDGVALPLHLRADSQVAELSNVTNVDFTCSPDQLAPPGVCGSNPCHNGGVCMASNNLTAQFTCACPERYNMPILWNSIPKCLLESG